MKNATELQLQKLALVLTAAVVLQVLWSGTRLLLLSDPDPIFPAEASLRVDDIRYGSEPDDELSPTLANRPVFWRGREAYVPADDVEESSALATRGSKAIDKVTLQGVYTGAQPGIIIAYQGERRRLRVDESVEDWTFTMMSPDGAIFESGSDSRTLHLEHALSSARAADRPQAADDAQAADGASEERDSKNNDDKTGE